jgi:uncharacterized protein (TIGR02444 family)
VTLPSDFWTFSLTVYGDPDVQAECLALQDRDGIDVNLLLFCAYMGAKHGIILRDIDLRQAEDHLTQWQNEIVKPMRKARRALKPFATSNFPIASAAAALREQIKALELEAERIEQAVLDDWGVGRIRTCPRAEPAAAITANIRSFLAMHGGAAPPSDLPNRLTSSALAAACLWN